MKQRAGGDRVPGGRSGRVWGPGRLLARRAAPLVTLILVLAAATAASGLADGQTAPGFTVRVVPNEAERRVDVTVNGEPFTAYIWPESLKKPVLYPLRTAKGTLVTRGYPLDPRPRERADHPHQVGLWFNYGDVNGVDFWNNSTAIPADRAPKMGTIVHKAIREASSGAAGRLRVAADWVLHDGTVVLQEDTTFVFRGDARSRTIDRFTTLKAGSQRVSLKDNKEGMLGLRVARALEEPADKPEQLIDASGKPGAKPVLDNTGVNGVYLSSEGKKGAAVWGTRGRWVTLSGTVEGEPVTIAILDHPSNPGYPTYWHARGYGLFAANPLGQAALSDGKETLDFAIDAGGEARFSYRIIVLSGAAAPSDIEARYAEWAKSDPKTE